MIALDTNVIARYLLEDDDKQLKRATEVIEKHAIKKEGCFISLVVLCELVWVLKSCARISKATIVKVIHELLATNGFVIEQESVAYSAISRFKDGKGDFSDYIISEVANTANVKNTYTFDKKLKNDKNFTVI